MLGPPLISVQVILRVSAWASHGGGGPWASALGRWVAGQEAGPSAGRRRCGQLCRVGASGPALCCVRAWSQTAPFRTCWDCWEAGGLDWGAQGVEGETRGARRPLAAGSGSVSLSGRPRIKVALGAEPQGGVGLAGGGWRPGPGAVAGRRAAGVHLQPHIAVGVALGPCEQGSSSTRPAGGPSSLSLAAPLLFVSAIPLHTAPRSAGPSACAHGARRFPCPQGSLPADSLAPLSSSPSCVCVSPSSHRRPEPFSLRALSGSLYLCLRWPGLHFPVSPGARVWVEMGVSLEKSLSASRLQLQAGCHGNRVRGPPLQPLSCRLGEGRRPACCPGAPVPVGSPSPRGGPRSTGLRSPDSDRSLQVPVEAVPALVPLLWAFCDPPHTRGHFPGSTLSPRVRLLLVTLPRPSSSSMADPSAHSDPRCPPPSAGPGPQAPGHPSSARHCCLRVLAPGSGEAAPGCKELGRPGGRGLVPRCVLGLGAAQRTRLVKG